MRLFLILIVLLLAQKSYSLTNSKPAIDEAYNHVVAIEIDGKDEDGNWTKGYCAATVLSERLLVTAGHCVAHAELFSHLKMNVRLGRYYFMKRPDGKVVRIGYKTYAYLKDEPMRLFLLPNTKERIHRKGEKYQLDPNEDLAMILLQNPLPLKDHNVTPAVLANPTETKLFIRNPQHVPTLVATVNIIAEAGTDTRRVAPLNKYEMSGGNTWIESNSVARVEPGDSGAPVFMITPNGERRLVAVVKGRGENIFWNWDAYPMVSNRLCEVGQRGGLERQELVRVCK